MSNIDVLSNAIKHIYETRGEEAFVNARIFHALLDDIVPTLSNERRILRSVIDDSLLKQLSFVFKKEEFNKQFEAIRIKKIIEDNNGLSEKWSSFIVETFMYASGCNLELSLEKSEIANESNVIVMSNGCKYEGELANGKPHGKGKYIWSNGDIYEGEFNNGEITGNGIMIKNGEKQSGYFENGILQSNFTSSTISSKDNDSEDNKRKRALIYKKEALAKELKSLGVFDVKRKMEIKKQISSIDFDLTLNRVDEVLKNANESNVIHIMTVDDCFSIKGRGTVLVGKLIYNRLNNGDNIIVNGNNYLVTAIESNKKILNFAVPGDYISILVRGLEKYDVTKGDFIYMNVN